jgi:hypothetical protein
MKRNFIIFLLIFVFTISCQEYENKSFNTFNNSVFISKYEIIYSDKNDVLGGIVDFEIVDSIAIMQHMNDEFYFSFLNVKDGKLIKKWGRKGRGPNEYPQLSGFSISNNKITFLDPIKKEINSILISDILIGNNELKIQKEVYPSTKDFRPRSMNVINNKKIVLGSFEKGRFGVLDVNNKIIDYSSEYPFNYEKIRGIYRGSVFQSEMKSSEKHSKFVIRTFSSDIFEIYQISDTCISKVFVSSFRHIPKVKEQSNRNFSVDSYKSIGGLMAMAVSDELICFTYSSENYIDARNSGFISDEILCFDWNGKKLRKYVLPFPIRRFCIDTNSIYGIRYHNGEQILYRFELSTTN